MKSIAITIILILALFSTAFAQEEVPNLHEEMMYVPMYESQIQDYRVSQAIRYGVKWTSIGNVPLTFFLMNNYHENCEFICIAVFLAELAAVPSFGLMGSTYGYFRGKRMNRIKKSDPDIVTKVFSVGHEFNYYLPLRSKENYLNIEYNPQYSLTYQHFSSNKFVPSEYRLGFTKINYRENVFESYMSDMNTNESKLNFDVLFNSNSDTFQLHYGIGAGYSWGEHITEIDYDNSETEKISGFFIYPVAGATINVIDFFYCRLEGFYEVSEFKKQATGFYGKAKSDTFGMKFSVGTYIF